MHRFIFILLFFSIINDTSAEIYYVNDTGGNDNNDGTTVVTAWKTISKVNSTTFQPGDEILFVRGGIWYETLIVSSSGANADPIIFTDYGAGSLPVIDGTDQLSSCIFIHTKNNVIVKNFSLKNNNGNGTLRIMYCINVSAENNTINATGKGGIFIENSSSCTLKGNTINTPSGEFNRETDGIYSQRNSFNIYEKNKILITNSHPYYHIDGIQSYIDESIIIRNNHIIQQTPKPGSQGIYSTLGGGTNHIYNNIVDCPNSVSSVVGFRSLTPNTSLHLVHNTLVGKGANIIHVSGSPNYHIKNNIFKTRSSNYAVINIEAVTGQLNMDHNLFYNYGNPAVVVYQGTSLTLQQWNELGYDLNSLEADPLLQLDYTLNALSPAIDVGINLGSLYQFDKGGTQRPQLNGVDIGAYEASSEILQADSSFLPYRYELSQNFPNPFNPSTTIRYTLTEPSEILIDIYDMVGNKITTLVNEFKTAGEHSVQLNAAELSSGIYLYRLQSSGFSQTRKMVLIK